MRRNDPVRLGRARLGDLRSLGWTVSTHADGTVTVVPPVAA